ncbi:MAG: hypothetical protein Q7V57_19060 [Actinomycetota bacterium]|nr:hypothetical protein [Actinomycetota bacterium]
MPSTRSSPPVVTNTIPKTIPEGPPTSSIPSSVTSATTDFGDYSALLREIQSQFRQGADLLDALCPREGLPAGVAGAVGFGATDERHPGILVDARADRPSSNHPAEVLALGDATRESPLIARYAVEPALLASSLDNLQIVVCIVAADTEGSFIQECTYSGNNTVNWYSGVSSVAAFDAASGVPVAVATASSSTNSFSCPLVASFDGQDESRAKVRSSREALGLAINALFRPSTDLPQNVTIQWVGA